MPGAENRVVASLNINRASPDGRQVEEGDRLVDQHIFQIKATLRGTRPPIWRRLHTWSDVTLLQFHRILQIAMGGPILICISTGRVRPTTARATRSLESDA